jgi:hypothetical protein
MVLKERRDYLVYRNIEIIANFLGKKEFNMIEFYRSCPYTLDGLKKKNRQRDIKIWRHIGIIWALLSGKNIAQATKIFSRHHSLAVYTSKNISFDVEIYKEKTIYKPYFDRILQFGSHINNIDLEIEGINYCFGFFKDGSYYDQLNNIYHIDLSLTNEQTKLELYELLTSFGITNVKNHVNKIIEYVYKNH